MKKPYDSPLKERRRIKWIQWNERKLESETDKRKAFVGAKVIKKTTEAIDKRGNEKWS